MRSRIGVWSVALGVTGFVGWGGLTILFFSLPEPEHEATLLDLELRECVPALSWREKAFALWSKRLEINSWATPPSNWRETFEREAASGSVLT